MVVLKSKFLSKFPIFKWSFVNCGLFKNMELTKYMIYDITFAIMPTNKYEKQLSTSHIVGFQKKTWALGCYTLPMTNFFLIMFPYDYQ